VHAQFKSRVVPKIKISRFVKQLFSNRIERAHDLTTVDIVVVIIITKRIDRQSVRVKAFQNRNIGRQEFFRNVFGRRVI